MRGTLLLAAACVLGLAVGQTAWADPGYGSSKSRSSVSMSVRSYSSGGHSSYHYRGYSYGYHHPPVYHPPVTVVPFPGHPPVVIQPHPPVGGCPRPPYHHYQSGHGAIGIYGPRFGFSLSW